MDDSFLPYKMNIPIWGILSGKNASYCRTLIISYSNAKPHNEQIKVRCGTLMLQEASFALILRPFRKETHFILLEKEARNGLSKDIKKAVAPIAEKGEEAGRKKVAVVMRDKRRSEKKDRNIMAFLSEEDFVERRLLQPFLLKEEEAAFADHRDVYVYVFVSLEI